ncbi:unnamed protein product [Pleuronectes platessa]|uniref:Uncharacterized protein n=1 Tax=Pleuronectes platessa TaxID=8262 RepID=A0A9N7TI52_PLEPL|nr:unnamed protein product [Pleuronectes platessa]
MSDSDNYPQEVQVPNKDLLQEVASNSSGGRRKSLRLAERNESLTDEADLLIAQLQDHGIMPGPGLLPLSFRAALLSNPEPVPAPTPDNILTSTLQSLATTLQNTDTRLENLENAANVASYSTNISTLQVSLALTAMHTSTLPSKTIQNTLASTTRALAVGV